MTEQITKERIEHILKDCCETESRLKNIPTFDVVRLCELALKYLDKEDEDYFPWASK